MVDNWDGFGLFFWLSFAFTAAIAYVFFKLIASNAESSFITNVLAAIFVPLAGMGITFCILSITGRW